VIAESIDGPVEAAVAEVGAGAAVVTEATGAAATLDTADDGRGLEAAEVNGAAAAA